VNGAGVGGRKKGKKREEGGGEGERITSTDRCPVALKGSLLMDGCPFQRKKKERGGRGKRGEGDPIRGHEFGALIGSMTPRA